MRLLTSTIAIAVFAFAASFVAAGEPEDGFFTTLDEVKIHYMTLGEEGSWVVLIHGYTDTAQRMWFSTGIAEKDSP